MGACCGGGNTAPSVAEGSLADPGDTRVFVVSYDNGATEEVVGIDAVRKMAFTLSARTEAAQDAGPSIHYTLVG